VLSVACGSLGVLTTPPENELRAALDRFAAGDWLARHLPALDVGAGGAHLAWAINDLVLARRGGTQLVVEVCVDGELYVRMAGTGSWSRPRWDRARIRWRLGARFWRRAPMLWCARRWRCTAVAPRRSSSRTTERSQSKSIRDTAASTSKSTGSLSRQRRNGSSVSSEHAYATLVVLDGSRSGLAWLRERGLISDSPRVVARENQELHFKRET
jgi:hypothetical protein